jgi:hypothetical protein
MTILAILIVEPGRPPGQTYEVHGFHALRFMEGVQHMSNDLKLKWLKSILAFKVIFTFLFWGLPNLFLPLSLLQRLGMPTPDEPVYLRLLGAVIIAFGVAYWYAYKDPVRNVAILKAGIVDNGLVSLVSLYFIVFQDLRSIIMLVSALLTFFFCVSFIILMPKSDRT